MRPAIRPPMRRRLLVTAPVLIGAALATSVLTGCSNTATTSNAVTPGPTLPIGYSMPPNAAHYQVATPVLSPTP